MKIELIYYKLRNLLSCSKKSAEEIVCGVPLNDYINKTLISIIDGVSKAQKYAYEKGACINPYEFGKMEQPCSIIRYNDNTVSVVQSVLFDICVGSVRSAETEIKVFNLGFSDNKVNRVKFSIPLSLPRMKPNYDLNDTSLGAVDFSYKANILTEKNDSQESKREKEDTESK